MAILSGPEILRQMELGNILIDPFIPGFVGPNSVDLRIGDRLRKYEGTLDTRSPAPVREIIIPEDGFTIYPHEFYLASTLEWTETKCFVPYIDGRSSSGRLGISVHETAGRGDVGFRGRWTLEISVRLPVRIYPYDKLVQITYHTIEGGITPYRGRYQDQDGITESRFHQG